MNFVITLSFKQHLLLFFLLLACVPFGAIAKDEEDKSTNSEQSPLQLTYCVDPNWAPYESIVDGQHIGISKQYLKIIEKKLNINFTFLPTVTWQQALLAIKNEECHFTPMLNHSPERAKNMAFSNIYFRAPNAIYAHLKLGLVGGLTSLTNESIAVVKGYRMTDHLKTNFPQLNLIEVASETEGLIKVNDHQVDLFIGSFYSSNLLINDLALSNIRIVGIAELEDLLRVAVSLNYQYLIPKVNKTLAERTDQDHENVFQALAASKVISRVDYTLAWQIAVGGLFLLLLLGTRYYYAITQRKALAVKNIALERLHVALEKKNTLLAELATRDHLTGLFNRNYLSEQIDDCIKLKSRYQIPCCMLLIDIDDFKQVNDKYGHQVGDQILIAISNSMKECARETDTNARWGGEEFVILCPSTALNDALNLANRFQEIILNVDFEQVKNITCSIGVAELGQNESEAQWFSNADKAMYQAKENGKNQIKISND